MNYNIKDTFPIDFWGNEEKDDRPLSDEEVEQEIVNNNIDKLQIDETIEKYKANLANHFKVYNLSGDISDFSAENLQPIKVKRKKKLKKFFDRIKIVLGWS